MTYFVTYKNNYIHLPNVDISKVDKDEFNLVTESFLEFEYYLVRNHMICPISIVFCVAVGEQPESPYQDTTVLKCLANPYDDTEHDYYIQSVSEHLYNLYVMETLLNHNDMSKYLKREYNALNNDERKSSVDSYDIDTFCEKFNTFLSKDEFIYDDCIDHRPVYNKNDLAIFLTK